MQLCFLIVNSGERIDGLRVVGRKLAPDVQNLLRSDIHLFAPTFCWLRIRKIQRDFLLPVSAMEVCDLWWVKSMSIGLQDYLFLCLKHQECLRKWRAVKIGERGYTHCPMCDFQYKCVYVSRTTFVLKVSIGFVTKSKLRQIRNATDHLHFFWLACVCF